MNFSVKFWGSVFLIPFLTACGAKTPDCADQNTKTEVLKLVNAQVNDVLSSEMGRDMLKTGLTQTKNMFAGHFEVGSDFGRVGFSLDNVINSQYDETTDKYACTATLNSSFDKNHESIQIQYASQAANNGEKHIVTMEKLSFSDLGALFSVMLTDISQKHSAELKKLRLDIGDEHISEFVQKKCNGFEKDERLCELGSELSVLVKTEKKQLEEERKDFFKKNLNSLRDTYNKCGDAYYKAMGLVRDGTWYGTRFTFEDARKQMSDEFNAECNVVSRVASELGVENSLYFMPEKDSNKSKNNVTTVVNNAAQGVEEHEEIDHSQDVSIQ